MLRNASFARPAATAAIKSLNVHAPATGTFSMALFPGTSEEALRKALAGRLRLPPSYEDGSDSFYLTDGPADGMVFTMSADGLPDKAHVTVHIHPPPVDSAASKGSTLPFANKLQQASSAHRELVPPPPAATTAASATTLTAHPLATQLDHLQARIELVLSLTVQTGLRHVPSAPPGPRSCRLAAVRGLSLCRCCAVSRCT